MDNNETRLREIVTERKRLRDECATGPIHPTWPDYVTHCTNTDAELAELVEKSLSELAALRARCEAAEAALTTALRQWRGYANDIVHQDKDGRDCNLEEADHEEGRLYRHCLAALKEAPRA